jgi:CubicO group peptidase (beta-lactamase class C family)
MRLALLVVLGALVACNNSDKPKPEQIDTILQDHFDDHEFVGSVVVADKGQIIYSKSFGKADAASNIDNTDSTRFMIGSLSKPFTAVLILRLVDQKRVAVEDRLDKYFTLSNDTTASVTIHQLLTHTSGLKEFINEDPAPDISKQLSSTSFKSGPGERFEYNNSGFVLLKTIAEKVTGKSYQELMTTEIFNVAGMTSSGVARNSNFSDLATGYADAGQSKTSPISFPVQNVDGAGSIYSTTHDMYKFDRALYTDQLISQEMRSKMFSQQVPETYGYGWFTRERGGIWDVYFHQGNVPGFTSFVSRRIERDQFTILLSNAENLDLDDIENEIARALKK